MKRKSGTLCKETSVSLSDRHWTSSTDSHPKRRSLSRRYTSPLIMCAAGLIPLSSQCFKQYQILSTLMVLRQKRTRSSASSHRFQ